MTLADLLLPAALIAAIPVAIDTRARRRASPQSLALLALVALGGLVLIPLTVAACLGTVATSGADVSPGRIALAASAIALATTLISRTVIAAVRARRETRRVLSAARACGTSHGDRTIIVPLVQPAAFVAHDTAVVSTGLVHCLEPGALAAVLAHEQAHIAGRHGRLAVFAHALRVGLFGLPLARRAESRLRHELEVVADIVASRQLNDPASLTAALRSLASQGPWPDTVLSAAHPPVEDRIARLATGSPPDPSAQRLVNVGIAAAGLLTLGAVCLALHLHLLWLGIGLCAAILGTFAHVTSSLLRTSS